MIRREILFRKTGGETARWILIAVLSVGVFVADTVTDLEIAAAVFYVAVVLIAADFLPARRVIAVAAGCVVLTLVSFAFTRAGAYEAGIINCLLSVGVVIATTYLALTKSSAVLSEHEARTQLARLARVNSLGEMTASIAHEVNQPLTGIVNSANAGLRWLAAEPPNLPKARQALDRIVSDANRASDVVAHVRSLARRADPKGEWLHPRAIVDAIMALSKSELDRNSVTVSILAEDDLPLVFADNVQIQQVLINMLLNAMEAMAATPVPERRIEIDLSRQGDRFVQFTVRDNGAGIAIEQPDTLFDAFYSTKSEGMGIGLAVSRSIIERHGGRVQASADPKGGARFQFTLPSHQLSAS